MWQWVDLALTYHGDTDTDQTETEGISSYRLKESWQCCRSRTEDAAGDSSWQPHELRHSADPHIKEQRIREDRGEKGSSTVLILAAHPHTCRQQTHAVLNHHPGRFDRALGRVWLRDHSSFLVRLWSVVSCWSKESGWGWSKAGWQLITDRSGKRKLIINLATAAFNNKKQ